MAHRPRCDNQCYNAPLVVCDYLESKIFVRLCACCRPLTSVLSVSWHCLFFSRLGQAWTNYTVDDAGSVHIDVQLFDKGSTRLGEAVFFDFTTARDAVSGAQWFADVLGYKVDPTDVVFAGSQHQVSDTLFVICLNLCVSICLSSCLPACLSVCLFSGCGPWCTQLQSAVEFNLPLPLPLCFCPVSTSSLLLQHGVGAGVWYGALASRRGLRIDTLDTPVVSPHTAVDEMTTMIVPLSPLQGRVEGMAAVLFQNAYNTNYPLYSVDADFRFRFRVYASDE